MSRGTVQRSIRIPDDVWFPAKAKAEEDGTTLSDVIREALIDFTSSPKTD